MMNREVSQGRALRERGCTNLHTIAAAILSVDGKQRMHLTLTLALLYFLGTHRCLRRDDR
jgi:hypothetical protein